MTTDTTLPDITQKEYWTEAFEVTEADLEHQFNLFLETETPQGLREITLQFIQFRIDGIKQQLQRQIKQGTLFNPANDYEIGQKLVFSAMSYTVGDVTSKRPGNNPEYGDFNVIEVKFADGRKKEFASNLQFKHPLNEDAQENITDNLPDAEQILRSDGKAIARKIRDAFEDHEDVVYLAGRWFLKSLLADVDIGHLHLAEAVLDINEGGPLSTEEIWQQIGMDQQVNHRLQIFSLDYALQQDQRFDEVGPAGQVMWYLQRMEPDPVKYVPMPLQYEHKPYPTGQITQEMMEIALEIDDELSPIDLPEEAAEDEVTITLTYPYRRTGTLPLSARLQHLFPTAYETTRIRTTLIDVNSGDEIPGWVVRDQGYVYGLEPIYTKYQIPIGAYVTVRHHEKEDKLEIEFDLRKSRTEWIPLVTPEGNRLSFHKDRRSIGAGYDDLIIFGVEDLEGLDAMWSKMRHYEIDDLVKMLMDELAPLTPQHTVHVKTLHSAMNLIRRCPPGPIFASLASNPNFAHVAGAYWRTV